MSRYSKELMLERAAVAVFSCDHGDADSDRDVFGSYEWARETERARDIAKAAFESLGVDLDKLAEWVGRRNGG